MKTKTYVPLYLEDLWNSSMNAYSYYSKQGNMLLAEIYSKNADMIYKAQFLVTQAINERS